MQWFYRIIFFLCFCMPAFAQSEISKNENYHVNEKSDFEEKKNDQEKEFALPSSTSTPHFSILGNHNSPDNDEQEETKFSVLRYLGATALVIALIYLMLNAVLRRFMKKSLGNNSIQLMSQLPLGQKQSIRIYKIENKIYILGCTEHHISVIDTLSDTTVIEGTEKISTAHNNESAFTKLLKKYV